MSESPSSFDRRRFHHLLGAAFGGLVAGTAVGCSGKGSTASDGAAAGAAAAADLGDKHACRGLNACKGQGADGKNACAGQGTCANVAHHACGGKNECRNLGGCGAQAGANECKGHGGCQVPLHEGAWETARKHFETRMKAANKTIGDAPAAATKS